MLFFRRFIHKDCKYANLFPENLFNKKHKVPPHLYVAEDQLAEQMDNALEPFMQQTKCDTVVELNPGIGLFTSKLLNCENKIRKIVLYETLDHFMPRLQDMHALYPDRVKVKHADVVGMHRIVYQDKMDNGTRVADLFSDLQKRDYQDDPIALLIGAVGSYNFYKHLINSIIFQNGLFHFGRFEMYLLMPPPIYIHLTCTNEIGYLLYRSGSILFQTLFEHRFITRLPREHFLPNQITKPIKGGRLAKVNAINSDCLYLVRIMPRRNLLNFCPQDDLQAFWYFVKQNCISRRNRIIPNLERWIPGCGPRLIINHNPPEMVQPLYPEDKANDIPEYSTHCTTLSNRNYYQGINIYTQFGDLSPSQMLTLFTQFRSWPEYNESSFLASLESTLLKMEAAIDENAIGIAEEDDGASEAMQNESLENESKEFEVAEVKATKRKRKTQQKQLLKMV